MKRLILLAITFSFSFANADYRTMPELNEVQIQAKLDIVNYVANYTFKERKLRKKRYGFKKLYRLKGDLHYTEYLHNMEGKLKVDVYAPTDIVGKKLPVILIFPPIGGVSTLDKLTARYFAKKGFIAVISRLSENILGQDSVDSTMGGFVRSVIRNRILLDYIEQHPNVDPDNIGVYGVSLGGIRASLFYSIEPRVKSASTVVGGLNLPGIMAYSTQSTVASLRERFMADNNLDNEYDYESLLRERYYIDASNFSSQVDPNQFFMVVGKNDEKVHTRYQWEMFDSFRQPHLDTYNANHKWSIIFAFIRQRRIVNFFRNSFGLVSGFNIMMEEDEEIDPKDLEKIMNELDANLD